MWGYKCKIIFVHVAELKRKCSVGILLESVTQGAEKNIRNNFFSALVFLRLSSVVCTSDTNITKNLVDQSVSSH